LLGKLHSSGSQIPTFDDWSTSLNSSLVSREWTKRFVATAALARVGMSEEMAAAGINEALVRISVGTEHWRDLLEEFTRALG
jgi:cystathionine beta-lyase/cystathionine gamma-synthase